MSLTATTGSIAMISALSFTGTVAPSATFLDRSEQKTSFSNYQSLNEISWGSTGYGIAEQIGPTFSNTFTGKPGFIITTVTDRVEYGHADLLDADDFLYE